MSQNGLPVSMHAVLEQIVRNQIALMRAFVDWRTAKSDGIRLTGGEPPSVNDLLKQTLASEALVAQSDE